LVRERLDEDEDEVEVEVDWGMASWNPATTATARTLLAYGEGAV